MKKYILILMMLVLSMSFVHADSTSLLIYSDEFDSAGINTVAWNIQNKSNVTVEQTGGFLRFNGTHTDNILDGAWVENTIVINQSDSFSVEWKYTTPNGSIVDTYTGVEISSRDHAGSRVSTPPTWCGVWVGQQAGSFVIGKGFPNALNIATIGVVDASQHSFKVTGTRAGASQVVYQVYYDSALILNNYAQNCTGNFDVSMFLASTSGVEKTVYFDDFFLYAVTNANVTGAGCNKDADCDSGKCSYGFCRLKNGNDPCISDSQCLSLECTNNKCADAGLAVGLTASKDELFGSDPTTALLLAFIISGGIALLMARFLGGFIGAIIGMFMFLVTLVILAFLGWVPAYIIFFIVIFIIGLIFIINVIGRGE